MQERLMSPRLNIVIGSTRPGRVGPVIADWFADFAREHGKFEPVLVDLLEFKLPVYDEPNHPRLIAPPALINAIDFVYHEWACKPAGILSYGGASGGMRSAQMLKLMLTSVRVMPLPDSVAIHNVRAAIGADGKLAASELAASSAKAMLDELFRWAEVLKPLRAK
jgi:NAD(P)H-dependent FMN reductase